MLQFNFVLAIFLLIFFLSFILLSLFWFVRQTKAILFWLYLWQLKEYRFSRFFDHFRTYQGKKLFLNFLFIFKISLLVILAFSFFFVPVELLEWPYIPLLVILLAIYFFEAAKTFLDFFQRKLKKPVLTLKAKTLITVNLIGLLLSFIIIWYVTFVHPLGFFLSLFLFLLFDILTPLLVSGIVFLFQPFTTYWQNRIIKKAKEKRAKFKDLLVIGISGSYGKTSTKEFLTAILSSKFKVLSTPLNQNTDIAIAKLILEKLTEEIEIFIVEMGAYKKGEIASPCRMVKPKIGILTGLNEQHLSTFGSQENIINTEYELIQALPSDGLAVFNGDNPYCFELSQKTTCPKKVYSLKSSISGFPVDIWTENVRVEKDFISFKTKTKDDEADFKLNLLGAQNIQNILGAALVAKELGMSLKEISQACRKIRQEQARISLKRGINNLNIIEATYSANPAGVISHLEYLKIWPGKKIIIMPCLIELGQSSKEVHKKIGQKINEVCDLAIITTRDRFKEIKETTGAKAIFLEKPKEILEKIKSFCQEDDVILLESRVPEGLIKQLIIP